MVADSAMEVEYITTSEAAKDGVWVRNFIYVLGVVQGSSNQFDLRCDSTAAIAQAKEAWNHQKARHMQR